jgi:putative restriction endonuclease
VARLSKDGLIERVIDPIRAAGWNVVFLNASHPFDLTIFRNEQSFRVRVYIWNVTHGGGPARATTEYRIQITGVNIPLTAPPRFQTLLFGWYEELGVVVAFDPERHREPSAASPSIQISIGTLQQAAQRGLAVQQRGNEEIALALRPDLLITYIENQRSLHDFAGSRKDIDLLIQAGTGQQPPDTEIEKMPKARQRVVRMVATRRREATFRARVLAAYGYRCAMCHLQLDLVEGAHIIPVGVPGSTDETSNGMALCPLHHEAYDDALVGVRPSYRTILNERALKELRETGRGGQEGRFRKELKEQIIIPLAVADKPKAEYLQRAMKIRRWDAG